MPASISVLGAGSWGTALALHAARNGCATMLWGHSRQHVAALAQSNENSRYLPGFSFPANIKVTDDLREAVAFSPILLISVPSHAFRNTLLSIKPFLDQNSKIVWATKGFACGDGVLLSEVFESVIGGGVATAVLSGPTFAQEVAANLPTAVTIASSSADFASELTYMLHNQYFRIYTSTDVVGVQVGGASKNVLAIAAGIADGLGFGANTRAALITRGLTEVMRLGAKLGGSVDTFMGLAGLGDLILTCTDNQSRNRRFGLALGQGKNRDAAVQEIAQEVEGISAAREAYGLSKKFAVDMPITEQVYHVLFSDLKPKQAVHNLLTRDQKSEI